jgi:hypothetical protein
MQQLRCGIAASALKWRRAQFRLGLNGAPGMIRTCDPRFRRPMLYPAELRVRTRSAHSTPSRNPSPLACTEMARVKKFQGAGVTLTSRPGDEPAGHLLNLDQGWKSTEITRIFAMEPTGTNTALGSALPSGVQTLGSLRLARCGGLFWLETLAFRFSSLDFLAFSRLQDPTGRPPPGLCSFGGSETTAQGPHLVEHGLRGALGR